MKDESAAFPTVPLVPCRTRLIGEIVADEVLNANLTNRPLCRYAKKRLNRMLLILVNVASVAKA